MPETLTPAQRAEAYKGRLAELVAPDEFADLGDLRTAGYLIAPDPEDGTVLLVINRNALSIRRQNFGHDLPGLAFDAVQASGQFSITHDWVHADIHDGEKMQPASIAQFVPFRPSSSAQGLAAAIRQRYEDATVTREMLPPLDQKSLGMDEREAHQLEQSGLTAMIKSDHRSPAVQVAVEGRRMLIDGIFSGTNPLRVLQDYIGKVYLGKNDRQSIVYRTFSLGYSPEEDRAYHLGEYENPQSIILTNVFRLQSGVQLPISELHAFRKYLTKVMMAGAYTADTPDGFDGKVLSILRDLPYFRVKSVFDQVMQLPQGQRISVAGKLLSNTA